MNLIPLNRDNLTNDREIRDWNYLTLYEAICIFSRTKFVEAYNLKKMYWDGRKLLLLPFIDDNRVVIIKDYKR